MEKLTLRHLSSVLKSTEEWVILEGHSSHESVYYNYAKYNRYILGDNFLIRYGKT